MTTRSHSTQVIPQLAQYFGEEYPLPIIVAAFRDPVEIKRLGVLMERTGLPPTPGWKVSPFKKHVSRSWLRKMRADGYTFVRLKPSSGREADFSIEELLK